MYNTMKTIILHVAGMHCNSCKILLESAIGWLENVAHIDANVKKGTAIISYKQHAPNKDDIIRVIEESGYKVSDKNIYHPWLSTNIKDYKIILLSLIGFWLLYLIWKETGILNFDMGKSKQWLWLVLLIGLTAGFSSCIAVVGGLVFAISAKWNKHNENLSFKQKIVPHLRFNLGRVIWFGILGWILWLFGSVISISPFMMSVMAMLIGVVMLILGVNLSNISPRISTMSITLPTGKLFNKKETDIIEKIWTKTQFEKYAKTFGSGVITFFLPCGFTFAMQMYAIGTGSFWMGMAVMALFAIGTLPGLLSIGSLTSIFKWKAAKIAYQAIGVLVILFWIYNLSNGYNIVKTKFYTPTISTQQHTDVQNKNVETINMTYSDTWLRPYLLNLELGKTYQIIIDIQTDVYGCMTTIYIAGLDENYQEIKRGTNILFNFTATRAWTYEFVCASMGMSHGAKIVIK